jgi:hypothetical protein
MLDRDVVDRIRSIFLQQRPHVSISEATVLLDSPRHLPSPPPVPREPFPSPDHPSPNEERLRGEGTVSERRVPCIFDRRVCVVL